MYEPSYSFSGAPYDEGRQLTTIETGDLSALLLAGDTVSVADTEGQQADFAAGPEYGMLTLDGPPSRPRPTASPPRRRWR